MTSWGAGSFSFDPREGPGNTTLFMIKPHTHFFGLLFMYLYVLCVLLHYSNNQDNHIKLVCPSKDTFEDNSNPFTQDQSCDDGQVHALTPLCKPLINPAIFVMLNNSTTIDRAISLFLAKYTDTPLQVSIYFACGGMSAYFARNRLIGQSKIMIYCTGKIVYGFPVCVTLLLLC